MLVGICGREGSGKTTAAKLLADNCEITEVISYDVENYAVQLTDIPRESLLQLFRNTIDSNFKYPNSCKMYTTSYLGNWRICSFADNLKLLASAIFEIDYLILLGDNNRDLRETIRTKKFNICGSMTGRQCLEYLGTEVFRKHVDSMFWVKLLEKKINLSQFNIIIPDIRFEEEAALVDRMQGQLWIIYRNIDDLTISESDRSSHISKWNFLTFHKKYKYVLIHNDGTIEDLRVSLVEQISQ